jgi:6-phosphogluconolactonase
MAPAFTEHPSRAEASQAAAALAVATLGAAILARGKASLMVSGGSTPVPMFECLASAPLDWASVTVGLVDERWVAPDHPDSNERLVREHLLQGAARAATFISMKTAEESPAAAAADRSAAYAPHCSPADFVLLGMGKDAHTASWFPGNPALARLVSPPGGACVAAVEAPGATVPQRMTLTVPAVNCARRGVLLLFGEAKRAVLEAASTADPLQCPVRYAMDGMGDRLSIHWAP